MTSIDFEGDINRILSILEANASLSDVIRGFKFGEADNLKYDDPGPYILVTTPSNPFRTRESFGMGDGSIDLQHSVQYVIKIITDVSDSENSERELYSLVKLVTDTLLANPRLKNPVTNDDPKCFRSFIFDIPIDSSKRGQELQIASIGIQCQVGTEFTIDMLGFEGIALLSKPVEREVQTFENIYDTQRIRKLTSPITETHTFFAEIEYVENVVSALRTQKRARNQISITLNRNDTPTVMNGKIVEVLNGAIFDQLETATFRFEVIH